jgi:hypothetical protein
MLKTIGLSPKVARPVIVGLVVAGALFAIGEHQRAVDALVAVGLVAGIGGQAPPGDVIDEGP